MLSFSEYLNESGSPELKEYVGYFINSLHSGDYEFRSTKGGMPKPEYRGNKAQISVQCNLIQFTPDEVSDEFHEVSDFIRQISGIHPKDKPRYKKTQKRDGFQETAECSGSNDVAVDAIVKIKMVGRLEYDPDEYDNVIAKFTVTFSL